MAHRASQHTQLSIVSLTPWETPELPRAGAPHLAGSYGHYGHYGQSKDKLAWPQSLGALNKDRQSRQSSLIADWDWPVLFV